MIRVIVQRPPADITQELVDPLISNQQVALDTGIAIIDREYSNRIIVNLVLPVKERIIPGKIVEVIDSEIGAYKGMVRKAVSRYSRQDDGISVKYNLTIERLEVA